MIQYGLEIMYEKVPIPPTDVVYQFRKSMFTGLDRFGDTSGSYGHNDVHAGDFVYVLSHNYAVETLCFTVPTVNDGNGEILYF